MRARSTAKPSSCGGGDGRRLRGLASVVQAGVEGNGARRSTGSAGCSRNEDAPASEGVKMASVVVGCAGVVAGWPSLARPRSPASKSEGSGRLDAGGGPGTSVGAVSPAWVQAGVELNGARRRHGVDRLQPERARPGERGRDDGLGGSRMCGRGAGGGGGRVEPRAPETAGFAERRLGETGRRGRTGHISRMGEPAGRFVERGSDLRGDVVCRAGISNWTAGGSDFDGTVTDGSCIGGSRMAWVARIGRVVWVDRASSAPYVADSQRNSRDIARLIASRSLRAWLARPTPPDFAARRALSSMARYACSILVAPLGSESRRPGFRRVSRTCA